MLIASANSLLVSSSAFVSLQVPNQLGGERFPDALETDNTVTRVPEKALPKEKAS